jgi:hypothetical protein
MLTCGQGYTGGGQLVCTNGMLTSLSNAMWTCCCDIVVVSGAESVQASRMGTVALSGTANGKGLYQNSEQQFLYFWPGADHWLIGSHSDASRAGVKSLGGSICPESETSWQSYHDDDWNTAPSIQLACAPPTGRLCHHPLHLARLEVSFHP